ncbi:MAG: hypothetical protein CL608_16200 [Anaerolineaceae bacterium]|nr:hypothetical protein [Anaerolineaceae bacterium]
MTQPITCTHGIDRLILSINGKRYTYPNDKDGKRQAILDGLNTIETMTVGEDVYLPSNESLQVVAAVLYPDGIQTEAAYQTVCQVTEKACAHLGYGGEVELGPPAVPFARRGAYRRQYPPVDAHLVRDELALAGTGSSFPRQEIACTILWNKEGLAVYGRHWSKLTAAEQNQIQTQVDAITAQDGWEKDDSTATGSYTKPLPVDAATTRSRLDDLLRRENGRPVLVSSVIYQAQLGAYGRGFYSNELAPALQTIVSEALQAHGYRPTPQDGEYRPQPVTLATAAETNLQEKLAALSPVMTEFGQALLLRDVVEALGVVSIGEWQAEQLVADGRVSQALRKVGYQTELTWCQPYHFQPKRDGHEAQRVILKEVRVKNDPARKLSLAQGLAVLTPALAIDDVDETLVYLEMVGAKQSVKANWAALVGGGKVHWLGRKRIRLDGMKEHVKIQATLPCGWAHHILIHKQASLKEMNPEQPFYLLDNGTQPIPPLFYRMLNKCLALPLLPEWAEYLWENGRLCNLIILLDEGEGQGSAAWRVLPSPEEWQELINMGLRGDQINI